MATESNINTYYEELVASLAERPTTILKTGATVMSPSVYTKLSTTA